MRVALAAPRCVDGDVAANVRTVVDVVAEHADWGVDLVCFPEAFLCGFGAISFDPQRDLPLAQAADAPELARIARAARRARTAVCVGHLEHADGVFHSAATVLGRDGDTLARYRRMSPGWRFPDSPPVYREGVAPVTFELAGKRCSIALCGDLFTLPERFAAVEPDVLLWPIHRDLDAAGWAGGELDAYARQANAVYASVLLANDVGGDAVGGAAWFRNGKVKASAGFDGSAQTLVVDVR